MNLHLKNDELTASVPFEKIETGDEFFVGKNLRFRMEETGARCISTGDTPPEGLRQFEPDEEVFVIICSEEAFEEISQACPKCENRLGKAAKYCNQCGAELSPTKEPDPNNELELCSDAEHLLQMVTSGAKFCVRCRSELIVI